ncbi:uncharacterized protein LOC105230545 [Bactrocera dorsalis]|uniref:Uncharacterized protein LOC105230545 n=1 Tax=Bactrocera dorsalis TaxID=27457 RepID=A0A6I9VI36_BACDO|nr:uncharacterized protein LOC105230545 [Bactrocera dorsalis]
MKSAASFVLLLLCLCICLIGGPGQTDAEPLFGGPGAAWPILRLVEEVPRDSLTPHRRVKRVKRAGFDRTIDPGYEYQNGTEDGKERFPVWDDAKGEPLVDS